MRFPYPLESKFRIDSDGYILVYLPEHPRAQRSLGYKGYVLEHLVVATNKLGRDLCDGEEVHHLDFNRHHNRWANLLVLDYVQHAKLHRWLGRAGYEPDFKVHAYSSDAKQLRSILSETHRCAVCRYPIARRFVFCSKRCSHLSSRKVERPPIRKLLRQIADEGYLAVGRSYGVSDNAIRKWVRTAGYNPKDLSRNVGD